VGLLAPGVAALTSAPQIALRQRSPKFAAMAVRRAFDSGWKPIHYLNQVGASIAVVLKPAGVDKAVGVYTISFYKDTTDAQYENDPEMQRFKAFMAKYHPNGDVNDNLNALAYMSAQTIVHVLKQCGSNLTAETVLRQATSLKDFRPELALPGAALNTSPTDYFTFDHVSVSRFDGKNWKAEGGPVMKVAGVD
jgi:branched-chain amino acid transport system substrate-binding protein